MLLLSFRFFFLSSPASVEFVAKKKIGVFIVRPPLCSTGPANDTGHAHRPPGRGAGHPARAAPQVSRFAAALGAPGRKQDGIGSGRRSGSGAGARRSSGGSRWAASASAPASNANIRRRCKEVTHVMTHGIYSRPTFALIACAFARLRQKPFVMMLFNFVIACLQANPRPPILLFAHDIHNPMSTHRT